MINVAEEAVNTAERFLAKYHPFHVLKRVVRQEEKWVTEFDVGVLGTRIVRITLDAKTGKVIEYNEVEGSSH